MPSPALVVFDLDGVLIDSSPAHAAAYEELYRALGIPSRPYEEIAGRSSRSVIRELLAGVPAEAGSLDRWVAFKQEAARRHMNRPGLVFPDASPALDALRTGGIPVAVGTSGSRATVHAILHAAGWAGRFAAVVTAEDVRAGKPDPAIFLHAMRHVGAEAGRTIIIEDSAAGLRAGFAAGAWVACVRTGLAADGERFLGSFVGLEPVIELVMDGAAWTTSS